MDAHKFFLACSQQVLGYEETIGRSRLVEVDLEPPFLIESPIIAEVIREGDKWEL